LFRRSLKELKEEEEQEEQGVNFQAGLALFLADNPLPRSLNRQDGDSGGADPGCLSRIPDPNFFHPGSELFSSRIPDPHQNLSFLNQKIVSKLSEIWSGLFIPEPDPGSGSRSFIHPGSRIQGSKRHRIPELDPQHWTDICGS
jgi:hypothetical protein